MCAPHRNHKTRAHAAHTLHRRSWCWQACISRSVHMYMTGVNNIGNSVIGGGAVVVTGALAAFEIKHNTSTMRAPTHTVIMTPHFTHMEQRRWKMVGIAHDGII